MTKFQDDRTINIGSNPQRYTLKAKLEKEWAAISQETIRAPCASISAILRAVVENKGHYIE